MHNRQIDTITLISAWLLFFWTPLVSAQWPPDFVAHYEISAGFVSAGKASKTLRTLPNGNREYISHSKTTGMMSYLIKDEIDERTLLTLHNNRPRPLRHNYVRKGRKAKIASQVYHWDKHSVASTSKGKLYTIQAPEDSIDQGAYQLALMMRLRLGERNFTLNVAEHKRMERYPIAHQGNKKIKTALGKLDTVILFSKYKKQSTKLWCAPKYHYLPVRIEHREGGVTYTAELVQFQAH